VGCFSHLWEQNRGHFQELTQDNLSDFDELTENHHQLAADMFYLAWSLVCSQRCQKHIPFIWYLFVLREIPEDGVNGLKVTTGWTFLQSMANVAGGLQTCKATRVA